MLKTWKFWKDTIIGTIFIFAFMAFAYQFLAIFSILDPVGQALEDMQITDQIFSNENFREDPAFDTTILIVNFGRLGRKDIARQINIINKYNPQVIGIDTFFGSLEPDTLGDLMLADALSKVENLVLGTQFMAPGDVDDPYYYHLKTSHPLFNQYAEMGIVNLIAETAGTKQEEYKVVREFSPKMLYKDTISGEVIEQMAFGVKLASYVNPEAAERFLARNNEEEIINYRGNVLTMLTLDNRPKFFALDVMDVLEENFDPSLVKDKIVLLGHVGESFLEPYWIEDKFFTPMNPKYAGRAGLDMYGVVIHANITAMVLNEDYLDKMSETKGYIVAIILCFLNVGLFTIIYRKLPLWYDGITKLIQLVEVVIILGLIIFVFHLFAIEMELTIAIIVILLAGDALEVLYGVGYNMFQKEKRRELFTIKEHNV